MHGIMIAGTHSGCGKTTVTLGITAALVARGVSVQSFKAGPDFIDAGIHRLGSGREGINLDPWMCGEDGVKGTFVKYGRYGDIAVVEGVMGLFDGSSGSAALASELGIPVILVIDACGMAESAGAIAEGFLKWATYSGITIAGILFNRVGSERHFERLKASVEGTEVLGYLPREASIEMPSRHLGLATADELPITRRQVEDLSALVEKHIDIERIIACASIREELDAFSPARPVRVARTVRIAIARDVAFSFYYEENLDLVRESGAEIVTFSPLWDSELPPDIHAVWLGGGYPELYARQLSENAGMIASLQRWTSAGKPLYAECGGLMYLSQGICDLDGGFYPMCSVLPFETKMRRQRARLGYREITLREECFLGRAGAAVRGHEFHYSEIVSAPEDVRRVYGIADAEGAEKGSEGFQVGAVLASYIHVHFCSNPRLARHFVNYIKERKWKE